MSLIKALNGLVFPTRNLCYLCGERAYNLRDHICRDCYNFLDIVHREVDLNSPYIHRAYYTLVYNRYMREVIADYKFNGKSYLYKPLALLMLKTIEEKALIDEIDIIMYIPAHRRKEAKRGYNQAELLASYIGKLLDKEVSHSLIKTRYTRDQGKLSRLERMNNLKDSFKIRAREEIRGKTILLVDDIITTGTTIEEVGKILIKNEARKVYGLALTSSKSL